MKKSYQPQGDLPSVSQVVSGYLSEARVFWTLVLETVGTAIPICPIPENKDVNLTSSCPVDFSGSHCWWNKISPLYDRDPLLASSPHDPPNHGSLHFSLCLWD